MKQQHKVKVLAGAVALALAQLSQTASADVPGACDVSTNAFGSAGAAAAGILDVYFAGASAPQNVLNALVSTYVPSRTTVFSKATGSSSAGADYFAICGTVTSMPTGYTSLNGKTLRLINRAAGGSGYGVYPIALNAAINIMSLASADCTSVTATDHQFECGLSASNYTPDMGVSDVEPRMFKGPYNLEADFPTQLTTAQLNAINTTTFRVFDEIFGLAATPLVTNVKSDFSRTEIASILGGKKVTWSSLGVTLPGASGNAGDNINVCRRVTGSGTQAFFNAYFSNFPCGVGNVVQGGNLAPIAQADGTGSGAPVSGTGTSGDPYIIDPTTGNVVVENPASGDVRTCLKNADTGTDYSYSKRELLSGVPTDVFYTVQWSKTNPATGSARWPAVGLLSLDSAGKTNGGTPGLNASGFPSAVGTNWNFTKIDGIAPVLENGASGLYDVVSELTFQYLGSHFTGLTDSANRLLFVQFFVAAASDQTVLRLQPTPLVYAFPANPNDKGLSGSLNCSWSSSLNWAGPGLPTCITSRWTRGGQFCSPAFAK